MSNIEILLGCWGIPPNEYPEDMKRCEWCYDNTAGSCVTDVPDNIKKEALFGDLTVDQMVEQGIIPVAPTPCERTGAKRFYTSTTIG